MANLIGDIKKVFGWVVRTFKGNADRAGGSRDFPGLMALWLFRIGSFWAALLFKITVIVSLVAVGALIAFFIYALIYHSQLFEIGQEYLVCPYLLAGFAVWWGWGWRSQQARSIALSVMFWLASAAFHSCLPIVFWLETHDLWMMLYPHLFWSILVVTVSLVAIPFELARYRSK